MLNLFQVNPSTLCYNLKKMMFPDRDSIAKDLFPDPTQPNPTQPNPTQPTPTDGVVPLKLNN
ncbi:hypothetical protein DAPPUDRAFT_265929 [Daphnia pulex]|uniref:Uncharacterized protein n=1 Tax=Daphnia pulex TaxID=6669 RepID=E9HU86_DAPPU|nr:hypothetical protein DAPPUDRAFT_265929 [Daphnia pulex]|eukprot:EFX64704.1 hypothetical protein DAPPUDRAFT_265929 [Daphnia pulex]